MKTASVIGGVCVAVVIGVAAAGTYAWRSEISPIERPLTTSFDPALVARGAQLATLGDCAVCHTAPGGKLFAGGLPLPTPFGTIYSTNITPDPATGIGSWSEAAFARAMREGVNREGQHLYPAFPYDHFTKVSDGDNRALYSFLMTREPVRAEPPANALPFPLNVRLVLAGWKLLFLRTGAYQDDPARSAEWNRGAYLAEGLGHCGACHTPRNILGAEEKSKAYAGGVAEGWNAYALDAASPSPIPWTVDSMTDYLKRGWGAHHGVARGPMAPVTANLGSVPDADARAIATYLVDRAGPPSAERKARAEQLLARPQLNGSGTRAPIAGSQTNPIAVNASDPGAAIYAAACSTCHNAGRALPYGGISLSLSSAMYGPDPTNPINVILHGIPAAEGERGPVMPGFAGVLTDAQVAALLGYMRANFSDRPVWTGIESRVAKARNGGADGPAIRAADGTSSAPANPTRRETSW